MWCRSGEHDTRPPVDELADVFDSAGVQEARERLRKSLEAGQQIGDEETLVARRDLALVLAELESNGG